MCLVETVARHPRQSNNAGKAPRRLTPVTQPIRHRFATPCTGQSGQAHVRNAETSQFLSFCIRFEHRDESRSQKVPLDVPAARLSGTLSRSGAGRAGLFRSPSAHRPPGAAPARSARVCPGQWRALPRLVPSCPRPACPDRSDASCVGIRNFPFHGIGIRRSPSRGGCCE